MILRWLPALACAAGACAAWAVGVEPLWLQVRRLQVALPGLPPGLAGLRLGLVADLHAGAWAPLEYYRRVADAVARAGVDALLVAGDVTSHGVRDGWQEQLAPFGELDPPLGRLAILGGHDHRNDARAIASRLEELGYRVLRNEAVPLRRRGDELWVVGLDDNSDPPRHDDFEQACQGLPAGAPAVVLAHSPDAVVEARRRGLDLVLSGHTHGGQVRLPFLGSIVKVTDLARCYDNGLSRHGRTQLFVSRGVASTYRLRFLCRPEVSVITLVPGQAGHG